MDEAGPSVPSVLDRDPDSSLADPNEREANNLDTRAIFLLGIEQISSSFSVSLSFTMITNSLEKLMYFFHFY